KVQEPVAQPLLFGDVLRAGYLEWQRIGNRQDIDPVDLDFHRPGRQGGIDVLVAAGDNAAVHGDDTLVTQGLGRAERRRSWRNHALRDAEVIAQVDEQQVAVIPFAVDPARQSDLLVDVFGTQHLTGVRTVRVHD